MGGQVVRQNTLIYILTLASKRGPWWADVDLEVMFRITNLIVMLLALGVQQQLSVEWHHNGICEMPARRISTRHWDNSIHVQCEICTQFCWVYSVSILFSFFIYPSHLFADIHQVVDSLPLRHLYDSLSTSEITGLDMDTTDNPKIQTVQ